jgi:hypothetical protein
VSKEYSNRPKTTPHNNIGNTHTTLKINALTIPSDNPHAFRTFCLPLIIHIAGTSIMQPNKNLHNLNQVSGQLTKSKTYPVTVIASPSANGIKANTVKQ